MGDADFDRAELDSIESVIGLSPRDPLNGFAGMLYLYIVPLDIFKYFFLNV